MYVFNADAVWFGASYISQGIFITILISCLALFAGLVIGMPLGVMRASHAKGFLRKLSDGYIEIFRNIPVLVQIVWFYYVMPILTGVNFDPITAAVIALGLNTSAFLAEIFRGGINGVPTGQHDASASLGFTHAASMRHIIMPQVVRKMLSPLVNQFIVLIKESSLVAYIGVLDIMHRGDLITTEYSAPLESYTIVAIYYFALCYLASKVTGFVEQRFSFPE
ncbi:amino acid ABC transporter permease [Mesorhizobium australicum]|uniref:amino acid ABC transporter permease n=1 Tax=Mesorhizobium australicum TaxID=536018 RepID=UPI003334F0F1